MHTFKYYGSRSRLNSGSRDIEVRQCGRQSTEKGLPCELKEWYPAIVLESNLVRNKAEPRRMPDLAGWRKGLGILQASTD